MMRQQVVMPVSSLIDLLSTIINSRFMFMYIYVGDLVDNEQQLEDGNYDILYHY